MILAALNAVAAMSSAMWMRPEEIPISRAIANVEANLKSKPGDVQTLLTLARLHSHAYATTSGDKIGMYNQKDLPEWYSVRNKRDKTVKPSAEALNHLRKSVSYYKSVIGRDPSHGLAYLGAGFVLEEASRWTEEMEPMAFWGATRDDLMDYKRAALLAYRKGFAIGLKTDFDPNGTVMHGIESDWLTRENGESIMRLVDKEGAGTYKQNERAEIEDAIQRSKERPAAITPILFPVNGIKPLSKLISSATTSFDLAGDQVRREWQWINSDAAWLVWDPENSGKITSGRQLFGTSTWWMMFKDGYAALATLDDNQDGWLKGRELKGIAVWHDQNGNAKSDPGEVKPVATWEISAIRTSFDSKTRNAMISETGIILNNGTKLPTYDWLPVGKPVK